MSSWNDNIVQVGELVDEAEPNELPGASMVDWAAAGTAGAVIAVVPGTVGAILGATLPVMAKTAFALDQKAWERRLVRGGRAVEAAAEELGLSIDDLIATAAETDARTELLGRVIEAAAATVTLESKVEALGRALADGLRDDAKIDRSLGYVRVLKDLEIGHFRVLGALLEHFAASEVPALAWLSEAAIKGVTGLDVYETPIMGDLLGRGCCVQDFTRHKYLTTTDSSTHDRELVTPIYRITYFGIACLELLNYEPALLFAEKRFRDTGYRNRS